MRRKEKRREAGVVFAYRLVLSRLRAGCKQGIRGRVRRKGKGKEAGMASAAG